MKYLLSNQNHKLGRLSSFSLPLSSCDKSMCKLCRKYCYAKYMYNLYPSYRKKMNYNFKVAKHTKDFIKRINHELKEASVYVRLHVSGDFFSQEYLEAWKHIARHNPRHIFYCYTKAISLDWGNRPDNFVVYLSDDQRKLQRHYHRFDGVATISFDKKPVVDYDYYRNEVTERKFTLCRHQADGTNCAFCGLCMQKGNFIYFNKH